MRARWVNLEVPINCVFLEHWNLYIFHFWGHSARAQWVNLEVPINCVLLEHCNLYIFPFLGGACHLCSMGKFGSPHKLCIIRTLEFVYFSFLGHSMLAQWVNLEVPINCVLLKHWNKFVFPLLGDMPCALWINLEVHITIWHRLIYVYILIKCSYHKFLH